MLPVVIYAMKILQQFCFEYESQIVRKHGSLRLENEEAGYD